MGEKTTISLPERKIHAPMDELYTFVKKNFKNTGFDGCW